MMSCAYCFSYLGRREKHIPSLSNFHEFELNTSTEKIGFCMGQVGRLQLRELSPAILPNLGSIVMVLLQ